MNLHHLILSLFQRHRAPRSFVRQEANRHLDDIADLMRSW